VSRFIQANENYPDKNGRRCADRRASSQTINQRTNRVKQTVLGTLAFAMLALALPAASEDISGWQEAKWGMTPDQVQKVLSYPTFEADLARLCSKECNEGAALELDDYELNGLHFTVRLWFSKPDKRLQAVSLFAKQLNGNDNHAFAEMKKFLETVYGSPKSFVLQHGYFDIRWKLPSTMITLISNTTSEMNIIYEERSDKESG
jgi:hypothetical protein